MIGFEVTAPAAVHCGIYTITGRRVRRLEMDCPAASRYKMHWDGRDWGGDPVASGTYLYRLEAVYEDNPNRKRESSGALVMIRE